MPKPQAIFTVILTTEHGDDVASRKTRKKALHVAGKMIEETIEELEGEIDSNQEGVASLVVLRGHLENHQYDAAIALYNKLHEDFVSPADAHYLRIKKSSLK